tara:strand:+ start:8515 stop:8853 length:339 start_codon:yes stop_codon:yes gene_type:complete
MEDLGAGIGGVSAAGILLVLVVREFLQYIAKRDAAASPDDDAECDAAMTKLDQVGEKVDDLQTSTQAMAAILSRTDPDGLPLCYTPRSLTTSLDSLAKSVERLGDKVDRTSA